MRSKYFKFIGTLCVLEKAELLESLPTFYKNIFDIPEKSRAFYKDLNRFKSN